MPVVGTIVEPSFITTLPIFGLFLDDLPFSKDYGLQVFLSLALLMVFAVKAIFLAWLAWFQSDFVYEVRANISKQLLKQYFFAPYSFHMRSNTGTLLRNVTVESRVFVNQVLQPLVVLFTELSVILVVGLMVFLYAPIETLTVFMILAVSSLILNLFLGKKASRWGRLRQDSEGHRVKITQESLRGIRDLTLMNLREIWISKFAVSNSLLAKSEKHNAFYSKLPRLWIEAVAVACIVLMIIYNYHSLESKTELIILLGLFAAAIARLMPSVSRILMCVQQIRFGLPVVSTISKGLAIGPSNLGSERTLLRTFDC